MSNEIRTQRGRVVGEWDGRDIIDLMDVLLQIKRQLSQSGEGERISREGIPHQEQLPADLQGFTAYIIWGCDKAGNCLVGSGGNRVEHVSSIREYYANEIARDALARER